MGMDCGATMIKYILFIFNLLCALCGIALLALGVTTLMKLSDIHGADNEMYNMHVAAILFIALGTVIFLIAFFGCCGAINESRCMISLYSTFLVLLLVIQIALAAWIFINQDEVKGTARQFMKKMWQGREDPAIKPFWDTVQPSLQCCGLNTILDWVPKTPSSCCPGLPQNCVFIDAYPQGCLTALENFTHQTSYLAYFILGVAGVELLGVIFACCLSNSIRNEERRYA